MFGSPEEDEHKPDNQHTHGFSKIWQQHLSHYESQTMTILYIVSVMQNPTQNSWILKDFTLLCGISLKCASKQEITSEFPLLHNTTRILKAKSKIITVVSHISEVGVFTFINTHKFEHKW